MSTKASIFLTSDNEHCYEETAQANYVDGKFIGNDIIMEFSKRNITIDTNDSEDLVIEIKPGSELYNLIKSIKQP